MSVTLQLTQRPYRQGAKNAKDGDGRRRVKGTADGNNHDDEKNGGWQGSDRRSGWPSWRAVGVIAMTAILCQQDAKCRPPPRCSHDVLRSWRSWRLGGERRPENLARVANSNVTH